MKAWRIDKETDLNTIRATTQRYKRKQELKITRYSSTSDKATRYNRIKDHLFMDTMFATGKGGKAMRDNICAQIFTTDRGFIVAYPLQSKSQVKQAIRLFCKEIGVPSVFIGNQAGEQTSTKLLGNISKMLVVACVPSKREHLEPIGLSSLLGILKLQLETT